MELSEKKLVYLADEQMFSFDESFENWIQQKERLSLRDTHSHSPLGKSIQEKTSRVENCRMAVNDKLAINGVKLRKYW